MSLKQHRSLPAERRADFPFARSPAGQWRWGLWKCVGDIWQVEKIFIFMGKRRRSKEGHSAESSSRRLADLLFCLWPGCNKEFKESVLFCFVFLLFLPPLFLFSLNCWQCEKWNIHPPKLQGSITHWTFLGPCQAANTDPPPASGPQTVVQSRWLVTWALGLSVFPLLLF